MISFLCFVCIDLVLNALNYHVTDDSGPLVFPRPGDSKGTSFTTRTAIVSFPRELLLERTDSIYVV